MSEFFNNCSLITNIRRELYNMSEVLVDVMRGNLIESRHRGDAVVVNTAGRVLAYVGNPYLVSYLRSSAKPIQALNVILSGADKKFGLSDKEIAIMCASHYGEDFHREVILGMLDKFNLKLDNLLCGSPISIDSNYAMKLIAEGHKFDQANSDCSGKHCGFLATCLTKGYSIETYDRPEHPLQQEVTKVISEMCEIPVEEIIIGEDGCGVPVHGMPLFNMALGFAKLANTESLSSEYKAASKKIFTAMNAFPEMLAGTNGFCTELVKHTHGKLIAKLGAEAVYCVGIKDLDIGIAVKVEDGDYHRPLNPAVMSILIQLGVLSDDEIKALSQFVSPKNINHHGHIVGEIKTVFNLVKI